MKVTVYSTTTCPFCRMLRDYLYSKSIQYEDVLLEEHPDRVDEAVSNSAHMGVPVTVVINDDGSKQTVIGFNKEKLDQIFK
ncbi:MAG: glutaredoxin-like protein, YruB-family [uncultured bacterium]|nr:MAG: glutaredoxin-like protein, YruB-family [uncultured bacterium]